MQIPARRPIPTEKLGVSIWPSLMAPAVVVICLLQLAFMTSSGPNYMFSLHWRHNERDGVSNQPHDCLLNCLFRRRSKKTPKLRVTGLCRWPVNSPHKRPVTRKMFPFDDVIILFAFLLKISEKNAHSQWRLLSCVMDWTMQTLLFLSCLEIILAYHSSFSRIYYGYRCTSGIILRTNVRGRNTCVVQCVTNRNCHAINYQRKSYTFEFISSRGHEMSILEDQDSSCVPLYSAAVQLKPSPMWKINAGRCSDVGFHGRQGQSQGWSCICKQYHLSLSSRIWACIIAWGPIYTWPKVLVCLYKTHTMRLPDLEYCILTLTVDLT